MKSIFVCKSRNNLWLGVNALKKIDKSCNCNGCHLRVKALFIAHWSVCSVRKTNGWFTDWSSVKCCRFKGECCCIVNNFAVESAHNTCDCNGSVVIANHKGIFVDISVYAVKRLECKRLVKAFDSDFFNLSAVECVHGLTHFKHKVVC